MRNHALFLYSFFGGIESEKRKKTVKGTALRVPQLRNNKNLKKGKENGKD